MNIWTRCRIRTASHALILGAASLLAACATGDGYGVSYDYADSTPPSPCINCGVVKDVRQVYLQRHSSSTASTVLGAVIGGVLGNTVGKGDGRKAATIAGAVAGGVVGNKLGKHSDGEELAWRVVIRLDDGRLMTVTQRKDPRVHVGDYVQVRNDRVYRL